MRIAFLDDSARPEPIRDGLGRLVALGAVVVDGAALDPWAEEFRGLCRRLKVPKGTEVKWSPPKGNWLRGAGASIRQELFERMLQLAINHEIRSIVVLADQDQVNWSEEMTQKRMPGPGNIHDGSSAKPSRGRVLEERGLTVGSGLRDLRGAGRLS